MLSGCGTCKTAVILLIIGGLNWGLIGIGGFIGRDLNVVNMLLGAAPAVEWIVYILVGLAALYKLFARCTCERKM